MWQWLISLFQRESAVVEGVELFNHRQRLSAARCTFCNNVFTRSLVRPVVVDDVPGAAEQEIVYGCEACTISMGASDPNQDIFDSE